MNPTGIYYAFFAESAELDWHGWIERAARAGVDILECSGPQMLRLNADERGKIACHARAVGLELTMAVCLTDSADISSDEQEVRNAGTQLLMDYATIASEMQIAVIGGILTGVGKRFPQGIERTREFVLRRAMPYLQTAARHAEKVGVTLAMETVNRFETPLLHTAQEALDMVEAVNSPALGILLDTFHMNIEERSFAAAIRLAGRRLVHFHVCENDRSLPGQGHIPWKEILAALKTAGYQGRVVIESLAGPYGNLPQRLNIWRTFCTEPDVELTQSIRFLQAQWEALQ